MTVPPALIPAARPGAFDLPSTTDLLLRLLNTPSPTGFTEAAVRLLEGELDALGVPHRRSKKGALTWEIAGTPGQPHTTFSGHVDTLGAMVKEIKENGRLRLAMLGGYDWATIEGEYVQVHTQRGEVITGTVVNTHQSTHVHGPALRELRREQAVMEVRPDAPTVSDGETRALGIEVGDFVSFDPRATLTGAGYLKSRHLDNKAAVAVFLGVTRALLGQPPAHTAAFHVTTYEEVGHGAATGIPPHTDELIAVDMAAVGEGQTSSEHHVTLCVADSGGPYDHALGNRLRAAARRAGLDLKVDLYPYYASDGTAAWRAGGDYPVALIGPGVDASHAYERTHLDALKATAELMLAHVRGE
ncbi:peptidase M42 [Deinococcus metallilatus]|uniref:Aminopeptidase FrvX n=1 Tax=Deinococcus metallilatus TaxID=1211322 RepID=A0AAJ5F318_9DEIO|nr:M42 family metallopeptidase [Deinococcus metallilatus]MBB5296388.1 putative aminopeptidase FrvX [Deinococcus metallilatus]QBY09937.1 peptidase M42 [Deinococcus metallilatus]RXJ08661.1 peptidase M42 [Deinococcus metallilatus]TLK25135.1 M42 family metallopeptidase [Deinococcus metallilatus]GMA14699.1 aminopeptidase [Deinococcus metallilatus]